MTDKKPLTFCIDWIRGRAEHTPMPASRATMESIVDYLEELESLKETLDMYGGWDGINAVYQELEDLKTTDQQAERPRTNGDVAPVAHGHWKLYSECGATRCSVCDWSIEECWDSDYCPHCGAKMDETDE